MKREAFVYVMVGLQCLTVGGLVFWWMLRSAAPDDHGFADLMKLVRERGPAAAVEALGPEVLQAGVAACPRAACTPEHVRNELGRTLHRAATVDCRISGPGSTDDSGLPVECTNGVVDRVHPSPNPGMYAGDQAFPGFLPVLYADLVTTPAAR